MARESLFQTYVEITGDSSKLNKEWKRTEKTSIKSADRIADKVSSKFTKTFAAVAAGFVALRAVFSFAKEAKNLARDAEEIQNKFNTVFESLKEEANSVADNFAKNFGLAESTARDLLSATGDLLVGFKFSEEQALDLSLQVNQLAQDLVSFSNFEGGAERASQALTSALLGETEAAKSLGIVINQNNKDFRNQVEQLVSSRGLTLQQAKALVILKQAQSQSQKAIGDYARTKDSLANTERRLNEEIKAQKEALGKDLAQSYKSILILVTELTKSSGGLGDSLSTIGGVIKTISTPVIVLITLLKTLGTIAGTVIAEVANFADDSAKAFARLASGDISGAFKQLLDLKGAARIFKGGTDIIVSDFESMTSALDRLWSKAKDKIENAPIEPKIGSATGGSTEALTQQQLEAFDRLGFLSDKYKELRINNIEAEAAAIQKFTGDTIAAKQYEIEQKKKLEQEYNEFRINQLREQLKAESVLSRSSQVDVDKLNEPKPEIIPKVEVPSREFFDEYLTEGIAAEEQLHAQRLQDISEFGNALQNAFSRSGDSFLSQLSQGLQIALNIASAINGLNKAKSSGGDIFGAILGLGGAIIPGLGFLGGLFKEGGSYSNKTTMNYNRLPKFAAGGNFIVPQGFPNDSFLFRAQQGEKVSVAPSNRAGETDRLLGILIGKTEALNATLFNKDLTVNVLNKAPDVDTTVIRNKKVERKLTKAGKNLDQR